MDGTALSFSSLGQAGAVFRDPVDGGPHRSGFYGIEPTADARTFLLAGLRGLSVDDENQTRGAMAVCRARRALAALVL